MRTKKLFRSLTTAVILTAATVVVPTLVGQDAVAAATAVPGQPAGGALTGAQRDELLSIAKDTWRFFQQDLDPHTHLPLDNLGPGSTRGSYTSAANIGVYLWSVVAAGDLGIIKRPEERRLVQQTLTAIGGLQRSHGLLYQWYDTGTGAVIRNPGDIACSAETTPAQDNCYFLSAVDNGWYASGLVVARQALPELRKQVDALMAPIDFSIFYDNRAQDPNCNVNAAIDNQPTGQMYGGYYVDQGPAGYHNGAIYSDPRIAMYLGMGLHQMPGDVWWRTWRTLPPQQCSTDPDFSWQGQWPVGGSLQKVHDPVSGGTFNVWEGHYTYPGTDLAFLPTWGGGMFEALMANQVVPETTWGARNFGLADKLTVAVQQKYATEKLGWPVWGMSPSSTADDTGGYATYGVEGQAFPASQGLSQCSTCAAETTVTPHASFLALAVDPQAAMTNINKLRTLFPDSYTAAGGFFDAVNPTTGAVGHRRLVLDQSMIMAGIDNALNGNALSGYFAKDQVSWAAHAVLRVERMTIGTRN
jgi:hypothetical protein